MGGNGVERVGLRWMEMVRTRMGGNCVEKICDKLMKSHSLYLKFYNYRDPSETKITHNHITLVTNATNTSYLNLYQH